MLEIVLLRRNKWIFVAKECKKFFVNTSFQGAENIFETVSPFFFFLIESNEERKNKTTTTRAP
jgi:hypothetical protein